MGGSGVDGNLDLSDVDGVVRIDTDTGELFLPGEDTPLLVATGGAGEFHWSGLDVGVDVTIRALGDGPLIFRVLGECSIAGTIDVSGEDGGQVVGALAGSGGAAGAGGGAGGDGGFADADGVTHGAPGDFPSAIPDDNRGGLPPFGQVDPPSDDPFEPFVVLPPSGGESVNDCAGCQAGHGAGGGYLEEGGSGAEGADGESGHGGFAYGTATLQNPDDATALRAGGTGGSGGGSSHDGDTDTTAPGTGGGGAGGYFQLSVEGAVTVKSTAHILARGGDAFQAPEGGGNAGAGAGGAILIEGSGVVLFEESEAGLGPEVSALGGSANRTPDAGDGNGLSGGGDGSPGRIAIRNVIEFNLGEATESEETYRDEDDLPTSGIHPAPSLGAFVEAATVRAEVITLPYDVTREGGVKDGGGRFGVPEITLDPRVLPSGTSVRILFSSADESIDEPGQPGEFSGPVSDIRELDGSEFLKIHIFLYSTRVLSPGVDEIEIPVDFSGEGEDP